MNILEVLHQNQHMQGFTSDPERKYMYWSFTDSLVKTNYNNTMIAQTHVSGGHLGDIAYFEGKLYASFLGNALPGHAWDDWTAFKVYVYNADDLSLDHIIDMPICDEMKANACAPDDQYGFMAIDGVTFGRDTEGNTKMFVACALFSEERFNNQILLQLSLDGTFEKRHLFPTGNQVYGIQTLDYDWDAGEFWFTTYGGSLPFQAKETLYCIASDLKTVRAKYRYSSPYGLFCLGGGKYLACAIGGKNGNTQGYAFECDEAWFASGKKPQDIFEELSGKSTD